MHIGRIVGRDGDVQHVAAALQSDDALFDQCAPFNRQPGLDRPGKWRLHQNLRCLAGGVFLLCRAAMSIRFSRGSLRQPM